MVGVPIPSPARGRAMRPPSNRCLSHQVDALRRQFLQDGGLPFTDVLTADGLHEALGEIKAAWNDRLYTPLVTLWASMPLERLDELLPEVWFVSHPSARRKTAASLDRGARTRA